MARKIDIYKNGQYLCSSNMHKSCAAAVASIRTQAVLLVAGRGNVKIGPQDKISARFDK